MRSLKYVISIKTTPNGVGRVPSVRETAYPRLKSRYLQRELNEIYTPNPEELLWAEQNTRGDVAHLGLLILLKISQRLGYFVPLTEIPGAII
ncbi:MAG: DUF4158 domain-containing protein, partial [Firmicutes bacterium]|nr:DUF4158 domain-containing protein [Bacillota bacterium]